MTSFQQAVAASLPEDHATAALAGRAWRPDRHGPSVVAIRGGEAVDVSAAFPTMRDLCETADPAAALRAAGGESLGPVAALLANTVPEHRNPRTPWLLAPIDLQAVKAAGVTFAVSMLERVIEERARGDLVAAAMLRHEVRELIGADLSRLRPGSAEAAALKKMLIARDAWSQYLEVGIGPDAEIFTKCQPMAAIGTGMDAGIYPGSTWNNPEPEIVLAVASDGRIVGAALGNDVNLRDIEGRSALLLSKAKDNNASAAIGPFIRLFDAGFDLDAIRRAEVSLTVEGEEGYRLAGSSSMARISRDPADLVGQLLNAHHAYPDGAVLYLGTMFAPIEDRDAPGKGFTHKTGDIVTIAAPGLGRLVNRIRPTDACARWEFGAGALMRNLAGRGLLKQ
ncbi:MAG: fumarylacetoacetate hydrolase family protein [Rhodospirillales bacterium]|nr:fumarylacetoacetate hydrolase family protein [Rhodospirillales bacterium]MDE2574868.1 fumarylacetoacetate hydrolase family protein [Rhodospirillales bacterium]